MDSWTHHDNFYELNAPQMSNTWMCARQYRITTSKWSLLQQSDTLSKLADNICGNPIIDVNTLSPESQASIQNEDNVRNAYIVFKNTKMLDIRTPGLIIPDPFSPSCTSPSRDV